MSVISEYSKLLHSKTLKQDPEQYRAVLALDALAKRINCQRKNSSLLPVRFKKADTYIEGIYFHGRVGRGKTMLMDLFYQQLITSRKKRMHFHRFMENVHTMLNDLKGREEPLVHIAKVWASEIDVLCFDEFFVTDIADAMLLSGLLSAMFSRGVALISTSNCTPSQLYKNGLQRERFLPTIKLINENCQVISIDGAVDYRLSDDDTISSHYRDYFIKENEETGKEALTATFQGLAIGNIQCHQSLVIHGRSIDCIAKANNAIWFDFMAICSGSRSQRDYIKLADEYQAVIISSVPQFSGELIPAVFSGVEDSYQRSGVVMGELRALDDEARRFIALVDEFYDRGIRLIIEAEVDIASLYQGRQLAFEFARCKSRLYEMQRLVYSH